MSDSVRPHRWQPTRLHHPWDSPGKNTGVGCHFLLQCMKVKSDSEVAQSCPTLGDPMDCSPPGSSIHGIFQARVLEWGAIAFSIIHTYIYSKHTVLVSLLHQVLPVTICSQGLLCFSPLTRWIHYMQTKPAAPRLRMRLVSIRCSSSLRQHWGKGQERSATPHGPLPACCPGDALPPLAEMGATEEGNLTHSALSRESSDINGGAGPDDFEVL